MLRLGELCSTPAYTTGAQLKAFSHGQCAAGHVLRLVSVMTGGTIKPHALQGNHSVLKFAHPEKHCNC